MNQPSHPLLAICRATDRIAVNPYSFDAGQGPGIDTVGAIMGMARLANCSLDSGNAGGCMFLVGLSHLNDEDLTALLQLAQVIK